jgi:hypothetical protein
VVCSVRRAGNGQNGARSEFFRFPIGHFVNQDKGFLTRLLDG